MGDNKNYYLYMLMKNGYSLSDAYRTYHDFLKEYGSYKELEKFIASLEVEREQREASYVGGI